jgi:beta-glucosidase
VNGTNEGNAVITETELRAIHLPGYIEAINQGVGSIMASYSSWNGVKMHSNHYLMTDVLKGELGFKGFIVSDWAGIDQLPGDFTADVKQSINAGIDMVMLPDRYQLFASTLNSLVQNSEVLWKELMMLLKES